MSAIHNCTCKDTCPDCGIGPFSRNHYFTGKLLVERDFRDEQTNASTAGASSADST